MERVELMAAAEGRRMGVTQKIYKNGYIKKVCLETQIRVGDEVSIDRAQHAAFASD